MYVGVGVCGVCLGMHVCEVGIGRICKCAVCASVCRCICVWVCVDMGGVGVGRMCVCMVCLFMLIYLYV